MVSHLVCYSKSIIDSGEQMVKKLDPEVLYRYRHLRGKHREWTRRIITDSVLHFANPLSFNDPFDCKIRYRSSLSRKQLKKKYAGLLKKNAPKLNRKMRRGKSVTDLVSLKPDEFIKRNERHIQDLVNKIGVLSLSATKSNILLWSHYAAGHTGICLKFRATSKTDFFGYSLPVKYSPKYPDIDILKTSPEDQVEAFLFTKATDWEYEKEWRIIDHNKGPGDKKFPQEMLLEVILGARMDTKDKRAIVKWVEDRDTPIKLSQASLADRSFSLVIEPYAP